ncbi:DNA cytosine methyltransferase [Streptomyces sp. MBT56]|uniref:DNA cytosine methyltransferase n=1 Tax=unclassified Streptomyces TaxID=2593676 RepID=UPI00190D944E|nr:MULTISPECIES: DNA cytosine methyltransferase [unclassified Streptomyces]MBK3555679.1 DNA cytosine methyltransferase [Streptomyces sp. MBT56]MBK3602404.1 DNA cytosine methyltransferase [Streptomyces sp. MBT54]MBK3617291.1 DNA cytosine methyltransferase [Streptomyces sp. MBT98]
MMKAPQTATHRPAVRRRRFRHDELIAVDLFSGFGGLTEGIKRAGFTTIMAANHRRYKVEVHEANHPEAEHWIADLVNPDAADYHSARDLPRADLLVAGVSCVNHSQANTVRAYEQGLTLFELEDPDFEARVTRSERDRATANCVLHYAQQHRPRLILIECTTELTSWGLAIPGRQKVGDGSTYRWWLKQFDLLNYRHKVLYLNSQFFGVPQSRDRLYIAFWDRALPAPDLEHRPVSYCQPCDKDVEAVWTWKTWVPPTGSVRYGKQYEYRCPSCRRPVVPPMTPSLAALDLTDLGVRIGDKPVKTFKDGFVGPLARSTMARAERCRQKFADFPAVLMPAKAVHGSERHPWQPLSTQTSQQETSILSTGALIAAAGNTYERPGSTCRSRGLDQPLWAQTATNTTGLITPPVALAVDNFQGAPRGAGVPLPTQVGSETLAVVSSGVIPFRQNTLPTVHTEAMPTVTSDQIPGLLTAAGWYKQNGTSPNHGTAPHPLSDPLGTLTAHDTTALLMAQWRASLAEMPLDDCYFRMMRAYEVGRGCGFDVDFNDYRGKFIVWGPARDQVDGFGNAVSPQVGEWIGARLRASVHCPQDQDFTAVA